MCGDKTSSKQNMNTTSNVSKSIPSSKPDGGLNVAAPEFVPHFISNSSPAPISANSAGNDTNASSTDGEDELFMFLADNADHWYEECKDCDCCRGYIHNCVCIYDANNNLTGLSSCYVCCPSEESDPVSDPSVSPAPTSFEYIPPYNGGGGAVELSAGAPSFQPSFYPPMPPSSYGYPPVMDPNGLNMAMRGLNLNYNGSYTMHPPIPVVSHPSFVPLTPGMMPNPSSIHPSYPPSGMVFGGGNIPPSSHGYPASPNLYSQQPPPFNQPPPSRFDEEF